MRTLAILICAATVGLIGCGSTASSQSAAAASTQTASTTTAATNDRDPDAVICQKSKKTGSHFASSECKTRRQRERDAEEAQRAASNSGNGG